METETKLVDLTKKKNFFFFINLLSLSRPPLTVDTGPIFNYYYYYDLEFDKFRIIYTL